MKKIISILIMMLICTSFSWCADSVPTDPPASKPPEVDDTEKSEIRIADESFTSSTANHAMYQVFTLDPQTYSYLYVGFLRDKPNTDPNVIPTSLVSYTLRDLNTIVAPEKKVAENTKFITDPEFPLWMWYRVKTTNLIRVTLSFGKIFREKSPGTGPCYLPYVTVYERDGTTEHSVGGTLCRGGWRPTGGSLPSGPSGNNTPGTGGETTQPTYEEIGVVDNKASIVVVDETEVKNSSRGDNLQIKILANYETPNEAVDTSPYKMVMTLTVEVKK